MESPYILYSTSIIKILTKYKHKWKLTKNDGQFCLIIHLKKIEEIALIKKYLKK